MYKHTRKEGLDYMEDRDKMNGNGMEKGTIGQDSQLRGGGGLLEDLAAGLECLYLSDLRYGYCQSALRFVLPCLDPGGRIYHGNGMRLSGQRQGKGGPCGIFKGKG